MTHSQWLSLIDPALFSHCTLMTLLFLLPYWNIKDRERSTEICLLSPPPCLWALVRPLMNTYSYLWQQHSSEVYNFTYVYSKWSQTMIASFVDDALSSAVLFPNWNKEEVQSFAALTLLLLLLNSGSKTAGHRWRQHFWEYDTNHIRYWQNKTHTHKLWAI